MVSELKVLIATINLVPRALSRGGEKTLALAGQRMVWIGVRGLWVGG